MRPLLLGLVALAAATAGCTAVVGGRPSGEGLPCWMEGDPPMNPCPAPFVCRPDPDGESGRCIRAACEVEVCNGADDDCDGLVDELDEPTLCPEGSICVDHSCQLACMLDADGDGFHACSEPRDCDDSRADINPNATEICDGVENDCDPTTDDFDDGLCEGTEICARPRGEPTPRCLEADCTNVVSCDAGEICDPTSGNCVTMTTDCRMGGPAACAPVAERCDPGSGVCVQLRSDGMPCTSDVQCGSERCVAYGALMVPPDGSGATGMCVTSCCNDADCAMGFRCWAPGNGVRACVPEAVRPISTLVAACSGPTCGSEDVCDVRVVAYSTPPGDVLMNVCTAYVEGTERDTRVSCYSHDDCASGLCIEPIVRVFGLPVPLGEGWCALPCGTSADCTYPISPFVEAAAGDRVCGFVGFTSGERLQLCRDVGTAGAGANGAGCAVDSSCRDGHCRGGRCAGVCCNDASCGAGEMCAPVNRSGWEMRCVPRIAGTGPT